MKALPNYEEQFCDMSAMSTVRRQMSLPGCTGKRLAFLILSGAFNPVHAQHVHLLDRARKHMESLGWAVVGGFLAPSSDTYVQGKLGEMALSLRRRIDLCELATEETDWISVCLKGEVSSNNACRGVQTQLEHYCFDVLNGRRLTGVEIMGSDTVVRIFSTILVQASSGASESTQRGRVVCCILRPGPETVAEREHIARVLAPGAATLGVELMLVEPKLGAPPIESVSSSAIRELVSRRDWEVLRSKGWLQPAVLKAMERWTP
jgi:nicotinic acid mononucleotide adenylyltransferase